MVDFVLGRLKFVYQGNWAISTSYLVDDIVTYGGRSYVSITNHTSSANVSGGFYTDSANWNLISDGIVNAGVWATSFYYKVNDIVKYGGRIYIATAGHTSSANSTGGFYTNIANWQLLNDGVENKSSWSTSTYYKINDTVKYGARTYIAANGHTSNSSATGGFYSDLAANRWALLNDGFENKSAWASGTYYKINDVVKWGSSLYICNTGHTAGTNWIDTEGNFTLFVGGLEFENSWSNSSLYQTGDIVRYGGYQFVATNESTNVLPTNTSVWSTLSTGFTVQGYYSNSTAYKPGDVVQFGGYTYVSSSDTTGTNPTNNSIWTQVSYGVRWNNNWSNTTTYFLGDVIRYSDSSYVSIVHNNINNQPDPANTSFWNIFSQGSSNTGMLTTVGDMLYLNTGGLDNVSIGANGAVLTVNSSGKPQWIQEQSGNNVFYVSLEGVDHASSGGTLQRPFRTIKFATENVPNNSIISVKAGSYDEILPITVPNGVSVVGDSQRTVIVQPAAGYSGAGNTMWLLSDSSLLKQMTFRGMTGFIPGGNPEDITQATIGGVFIRFNPASVITIKSPYILECSSISTGGVGVIVDGSVHGTGNRSMLFHAYTNINNDGVGYWIKDNGRAELVSCFTYFCYFGFATTGGGFIRGLNNNNSYGKYGAVSRGFDTGESTLTGKLHGNQLQFTSNTSMAFTVGETITGANSAATGTVLNVQGSVNKLYYLQTNGTFNNSEIVTGATSNVTATITGSGVTGQKGFVLVGKGFSYEPKPGTSIQFANTTSANDSSAYVISSVSGTYVNSNSVVVMALSQEKPNPSSNGEDVIIRANFSQIRLTGHDFLDIGTGNTVTANAGGIPSTPAVQGNEVIEVRPGRVYYVSTDQQGNFRVGDYFRIDQATGRATLDASAFDLSGLTSLKLGSIGAQLGETINEFSADATLGGASNLAVPTEFAVKTYVDNKVANGVAAGVSNVTANSVSYSNAVSGIVGNTVYEALNTLATSGVQQVTLFYLTTV